MASFLVRRTFGDSRIKPSSRNRAPSCGFVLSSMTHPYISTVFSTSDHSHRRNRRTYACRSVFQRTKKRRKVQFLLPPVLDRSLKNTYFQHTSFRCCCHATVSIATIAVYLPRTVVMCSTKMNRGLLVQQLPPIQNSPPHVKRIPVTSVPSANMGVISDSDHDSAPRSLPQIKSSLPMNIKTIPTRERTVTMKRTNRSAAVHVAASLIHSPRSSIWCLKVSKKKDWIISSRGYLTEDHSWCISQRSLWPKSCKSCGAHGNGTGDDKWLTWYLSLSFILKQAKLL